MCSVTNATGRPPAGPRIAASHPGISGIEEKYASPVSTNRIIFNPGEASWREGSAAPAKFSRAAANTSSADTPHSPSRSQLTYRMVVGRSITTSSLSSGIAGRATGALPACSARPEPNVAGRNTGRSSALTSVQLAGTGDRSAIDTRRAIFSSRSPFDKPSDSANVLAR